MTEPTVLLCSWPGCEFDACVEVKQGLHEPFVPVCTGHRGDFDQLRPFEQKTVNWQPRRRRATESVRTAAL
jgi:hypothetical protein